MTWRPSDTPMVAPLSAVNKTSLAEALIKCTSYHPYRVLQPILTAHVFHPPPQIDLKTHLSAPLYISEHSLSISFLLLLSPLVNPKSVISTAGGNSRSPAGSSSSSAFLGPPTAATATLGVGGGGGFSRFDRKSSRYRNRTISGLPTIGEANQPNRSRARRSASDRGSARRGYGTGSQKVKTKVDVETTPTNATDTKGTTRRYSCDKTM